MKAAFALVAVALTAASASAQYGAANWNFFGPANSQVTSKPTAISAVGLASAVGSPNEPTVNMLNSKQWSNQEIADPNQYYTFSVTTAQPLSIQSVFVNALSSNVGPASLDLRSSLDNFTATIATQSITPNTLSPRTFMLPVVAFGEIAGGTTVTFRLYGYNASNNGTNSTLGFLSTSASQPGISVNTALPGPEPVLAAFAAFALLPMLFYRR
jgi:hypothetical protein